MKVFFNNQIDKNIIDQIKHIYDPSYSPRTSFPLNRTIVNTETKQIVQLDIFMNICEVILPNNQEVFKTGMIRYIVEFLIDSLKKLAPYKVVNEIGFKLIFYVKKGHRHVTRPGGR